jgi:hypothetical protein
MAEHPAALASSGGFAKGIGIEPLGVGPIEVWSRYGSATGLLEGPFSATSAPGGRCASRSP